MSHSNDAHQDEHGTDVNVGLLATLFVVGVLFLTAFIFFMIGFFDYMAYQGRLEKVVNRPSPVLNLKSTQSANLHGGGEKVRINEAMDMVVAQYKSADSSD